MKNLNSFGVVEMTQQDMMMVEGGSWFSNFLKEVAEIATIIEGIVETIKKIF